jgi:hypothetical protein
MMEADWGGFLQVIQQLGSLQAVDGPDPTYHDICYAGAGMWVIVPDCILQVIRQHLSFIVDTWVSARLLSRYFTLFK